MVLYNYKAIKRTTLMKNFWEDVLLLPYKSNSRDNPHHEKQVEELIIKHGFDYVYQPNGTQKSPDFRIRLDNGRNVDIECKSSKKTYPTYNGGLPKKGTVYVFSSAEYDETTIYFAEDVVSERKRELYAQLVEDLNSVLKTYQIDDDWQEDDRGFDFYMRAMYTQSGGADKKDYFKHSERQICEQKVLNHNW